MSAVDVFTLERAQDSYIIISTGGAGTPGAAGPEGPSATPGMQISDPFIDGTGHVAFNIITNWGLDSSNQPYYDTNPNNIPVEDRAFFDWDTLELVRGGPGIHPPDLPDHYIGDWTPFTTFGVNSLVSHDGVLYRVNTAFQSGATFAVDNMEAIAGSTGPVGELVLLDDEDRTAYSGETGQFIVYWSSLTANRTVTLAPWRYSSDTTHRPFGWFVIARQSGATGPFTVNVIDGQGGTTIATLPTPLSWALCLWDSTGWQFVMGSSAGGSGTSAVTSVNGHVGDVQLQPADIIGVAALTDVTAAVATETSRAVAAEAGKYTKPGSGIPITDLESAARTGITLAESALQTAPVTTVNSRTGDVTGLAEATDLATTNANVATNTTNIASNTTAIAGKVSTSDSRLTDARTPTAHAVTHGSGGTDALTLAESQVTGLTTDLAAKSISLTPTAVKTAGYSAGTNELVPVSTASGAVTVTLPTAPADKTRVAVKHVIQAGTNAVTVQCGGSDVFNKTGGATSLTLSLLAQAVMAQYNASGAIWYVTSDDLPLSQLDLRYLPIATVLPGQLTPIAKTTTYTAAANDYVIASTSGGAWTVTAPTPTANTVWGVNLDVGGNTLTIAGTGLTGLSIPSSAVGASYVFIADGSKWRIL